MLIVDAQVHVWGAGTPLAHHRQISSYSADDLLQEMDEGGAWTPRSYTRPVGTLTPENWPSKPQGSTRAVSLS